MKLPFFTIFAFISFTIAAQKPEYAVALIPANLKENTNAVVRLERIDIAISSRNSVSIHTFRVVTIFNELGLKNINAAEYRNVKSISAVIYNASGMEIKRVKRKDFREVSVSEGAIMTDNKTTFLDYTPTEYPFTVIYESEVGDSNTAFIPNWYPQKQPFVSAEKSEVNVSCVAGLGFKFKEYNFANRDITKQEKPNGVSFTLSNLQAIKSEQYSPSFNKLVPCVRFGLEKFNLEGVDGEATSWENFSSWNYNNLLAGTDELSPETQAKVKALVGTETDPMQKARIIYQYVQDKTRYVSIQLGIGGWRPMKAKDVDRLGYGDCKALTNYTRSLLNVVGVPSYYTIVYGDEDKTDLQPDFVSMQGNHVILALPDGDKLKWLECTSQTVPFNFQGEFTDDRMALIVKPQGGQLVKTTIYKTRDNSQVSKGKYSIGENGSLSGDVVITTKGTQYGDRLGLERKSVEERKTFYKDYFAHINNLELKKINLDNDKGKTEFTEDLSLGADGYASVANDRIIFPINAFNQYSSVPKRYRTRSNPFEISRGFYDEDEITILLPDGYAIEAKPENVQYKDKFGEYRAEYVMVNPHEIRYKRTLQIDDNLYENGDYENFRNFMEKIAKTDNSKVVLIKNQSSLNK